MSVRTFRFSHKGWFGFCPCYFDDVSLEAPMVVARHWSLAWLMWLSETAFGLWFTLRAIVDSNFEPRWPLRVTADLDPPIVMSFRVAE